MERLVEGIADVHQPGDITLQGWNTILPDVIYTLNNQLLYGVVSPTGKIYVSGNQGVGAIITSLPIKIINPIGEFVPRLYGFGVLMPKGDMFPAGNTTSMQLNIKLRLPSGHIRLLTPRDLHLRRGIST